MSSTLPWEKTISDVNDGILVGERKPHKSFYVAITISTLCLLVGVVAWILQITYGMGLSGLNSLCTGVFILPLFLGWDWSCRDTYFCYFIFVSS